MDEHAAKHLRDVAEQVYPLLEGQIATARENSRGGIHPDAIKAAILLKLSMNKHFYKRCVKLIKKNKV